jgi:hypothetical protein
MRILSRTGTQSSPILATATWMLVVGLNLRFLGGCMAAFRLSADSRLLVTEAIMGAAVLFVVLSGLLAAVHYGLSRIKPRYRFLTGVFFCYLFVVILRCWPDLPSAFAGIRRAFTWLGPPAFLYPLLILIGSHERLWKVLRPVLAIHCFIGIPIVLLTMDWVSLEGTYASDVAQYQPIGLLYGFPFLIIGYRMCSPFEKIAGITALITYLFFGISSNRRAYILLVIITLMLVAIIHWRTRGIQSLNILKQTQKYDAALLIFIILGIILVLLAFPEVSERIAVGTEVLGERWSEMNRSKDFYGFIEDMDLKSWIIGRGALGGYTPIEDYYKYIGGPDGVIRRVKQRQVVDIGLLSVILKGGIILAGLVLLVPCAGAIEAFFRTHNYLTATCAGIVLLWITKLTYRGPIINTLPEMILLWLCAGRCLSVSYNSRS